MREIACPSCGAFQHVPEVAHGSTISCSVCRAPLEHTFGRSPVAALCCAVSVLLLLVPANLLPFLTTSVIGVYRHSRLISSANAMWGDGWPLLAILIGLFVVLLPIVRFSLLTLVLGSLHMRRTPPWLGPAFRWANRLQPWAMPEVFLLGLWVAYARLSATISVQLEAGAACFVLAGCLSLFTRAALDKADVWRRIFPDRSFPANEPLSACMSCNLLAPSHEEGQPCPRCHAKIASREPESVGRAAALTLAGLIFYLPANIFPIATLPIGLSPTRYNVLQGVIDLTEAHLLGLALLVFTASFAIPLLKLIGLTYCIVSVLRRSPRRLIFKTRVYRLVEEIGRWSMVDPFVIACFVPVMQYNALIYGRAETAAPFFAIVVVLTMIAAHAFDPRLMWDAAVNPRTTPGDRFDRRVRR